MKKLIQYTFISLLCIHASGSSAVSGPSQDAFAGFVESGKSKISERLSHGVRIYSKITQVNYINQVYFTDGQPEKADDLSADSLPLMQKDVLMLEEISNDFYRIEKNVVDQNAVISDGQTSATSTTLNTVYIITPALVFQGLDNIFEGRLWTIQERSASNVPFNNEPLSVICQLFFPYTENGIVNLNSQSARNTNLPEEAIEIKSSEDGKCVEFNIKNSSKEGLYMHKTTFLASSPEKLVSWTKFKSSGPVAEHVRISYDDNQIPKAIETFLFWKGECPTLEDSDLYKNVSVYFNHVILDYQENVQFQEDNFDGYSQIKTGDRIVDNVNHARYIVD